MATRINYFSRSSQLITEVARVRGYTVTILIPNKNLYTINDGKKTVLFKSTDFGYDTSLAHKIADDKEMTSLILGSHDFPIIPSIFLSQTDADTLDFENLPIAYPIVVKPVDASSGEGVTVNVCDTSFLKEAIKHAFDYSPSKRIIIQAYITGEEYRVYVLWGKTVIAIHRIPPSVTGNGRDTIAVLIETENHNPERGDGYNKKYMRIPIDLELRNCLHVQGYTLESILPVGLTLRIRGNSNIGTGGTHEDVTESLCQSIKDNCAQIATIIGLGGLAGLDIITHDITRPLKETGGVIVECNNDAGIATTEAAGKILDFVFKV